MHPVSPRLILAMLAPLLTIALAGCWGPEPTYIEKDASYDADSVLTLPDGLEPEKLAEQPTDQAEDLRHDALVELRKQGDGAADAAELITRTFPAGTRAVPFYVERATFENQPALIIVEAIGREGEMLADKRVWVLSQDGEVLLSGTR